MNKFLSVVAIPLLISCGSIRYIPSSDVRVQIKDSIITVLDTCYIVPPQESVEKNVSVPDTLKMETSLAEAEAWYDSTTNTLKGRIANKSQQKLPIIAPRTLHLQYRDSVRIERQPYEVKVEKKVVPSWCWWSLGANILIILLIVLKIYLKLKPL